MPLFCLYMGVWRTKKAICGRQISSFEMGKGKGPRVSFGFIRLDICNVVGLRESNLCHLASAHALECGKLVVRINARHHDIRWITPLTRLLVHLGKFSNEPTSALNRAATRKLHRD